MGMFPDNDLDFDVLQQEYEEQNTIGKSYLYDFVNDEFVLKDGKFIEINDEEVVKQWIEKCIRTEKDKFKVYKNVVYGVPLEELFRNSRLPRQLVESEMEREIKEALKEHFLIEDIINFRLEREGTKGVVYFSVITKLGINLEVSFDV